MGYRVYHDGMYSDVVKTGKGETEDVFDTFGEAKQALIDYLANIRDEYAFAVRRARKITKRAVDRAA